MSVKKGMEWFHFYWSNAGKNQPERKGTQTINQTEQNGDRTTTTATTIKRRNKNKNQTKKSVKLEYNRGWIAVCIEYNESQVHHHHLHEI